ncbi:MAG: Asp23/Gls24 family envelope stress response protein [Oscillospiraceae bacterium]
MIKKQNHLGTIKFTDRFIRQIVTETAKNCFGVVGMNAYGAIQSAEDVVLKNNFSDKGVIIKHKDDKLTVDLHISVSYGVNVQAIADSVSHKIQFVLNEQTGLSDAVVNIFVDKVV